MHRPERPVLRSIRRIIRQRVLVPDIVRHLLADCVHVVHVLWEKRQPARSLRNFRQRFLRVLRAALVFLAKQTNRVNHRRRLLNLAQRLLQRVPAGVVFPVRHDQQHLLLFHAFLQVIQRPDDGIVKSRAAPRVNPLQRFLQLRNAA